MMRKSEISLSRLMIHTASGVAWMILSPPYRYADAQSTTQPPPYSTELYSDFDPSMVIVVLVLVFSFFFVALFTIYVRYCYYSTGGDVQPSRAAADVARQRGLDPAVIETFPTLVYSEVKNLKIGKGALECAVCLSEFEDDETLRLIPKCDHVFHPECIDAWLASHSTCPVCRANLTTGPDETVKVTESNNELNQNQDQNQSNSVSEPGPVVIDVNDEQTSIEVQGQVPDTASKNAVVPPKFPRSHTTGHSLVQAGINVDRYTLRLPEEIRKQIIMREKFKRTQSLNVVLAREGSSRDGRNRSGQRRGEGSGRGRSYVDRLGAWSDRWVFSMTRSFVSRKGSVNSVKVGSGESQRGDGSSNGRTLSTAGKAPLNFLNVKVEQQQQGVDSIESSSSSSRPPI